MPSVDDIANQIYTCLKRNPYQTLEDIGSCIGRPPAFVKSICALRKIELGKAPPPKCIIPPRKYSYTKHKDHERKDQVVIHEIDYCNELLEFQKWAIDKEFNFKLGIVFAMKVFTNLVNKSPDWQKTVGAVCDPKAHEGTPESHRDTEKPRTDPEAQDNHGGSRTTTGVQPECQGETSPGTN